MILVDTSAWICFFRGTEPVASRVAQMLEDNQVALCGPVFTEILRGFRSEKEKTLVTPLLEGCRYLSQPDRLWEDAGNCGFILMRKGQTVHSMDLLIACYALAHSVPLFAVDRDFRFMKKAGIDINLITI